MELATEILKKREASEAQADAIVAFLNKNIGRIFSPATDTEGFEGVLRSPATGADRAPCDDLLDHMVDMIGRCRRLLAKRGRPYKRRIAQLLREMHNIPRVYMSDVTQNFFCTPTSRLNYAQIKELLSIG